MTKIISYNCDNCGLSSLDITVFNELETKINNIRLFVSMDGKGKEPQHLCKYCIIDNINALDDRPKQV